MFELQVTLSQALKKKNKDKKKNLNQTRNKISNQPFGQINKMAAIFFTTFGVKKNSQTRRLRYNLCIKICFILFWLKNHFLLFYKLEVSFSLHVYFLHILIVS